MITASRPPVGDTLRKILEPRDAAVIESRRAGVEALLDTWEGETVVIGGDWGSLDDSLL
jgi:hypothetical protein